VSLGRRSLKEATEAPDFFVSIFAFAVDVGIAALTHHQGEYCGPECNQDIAGMSLKHFIAKTSLKIHQFAAESTVAQVIQDIQDKLVIGSPILIRHSFYTYYYDRCNGIWHLLSNPQQMVGLGENVGFL
jgi:hypothetical protein